jgi:hypothetical protein
MDKDQSDGFFSSSNLTTEPEARIKKRQTQPEEVIQLRHPTLDSNITTKRSSQKR